MIKLQLNVEKEYPNDVGRGIARLDPDAFSHLGLQTGDPIEITGNDTTAATVWRADRHDWNTETVRLDGFTRQNADVGIGERVEMRWGKTTIADSLTVTPPEEAPQIDSLTFISPEEASVQVGSDVAAMAKRCVLKRLVIERDIVPVMLDTNRPFPGALGKALPLRVIATEPHGVVRVTEETAVTLQEEDE
jgi:transitional endoplasmic reticulum ATPase